MRNSRTKRRTAVITEVFHVTSGLVPVCFRAPRGIQARMLWRRQSNRGVSYLTAGAQGSSRTRDRSRRRGSLAVWIVPRRSMRPGCAVLEPSSPGAVPTRPDVARALDPSSRRSWPTSRVSTSGSPPNEYGRQVRHSRCAEGLLCHVRGLRNRWTLKTRSVSPSEATPSLISCLPGLLGGYVGEEPNAGSDRPPSSGRYRAERAECGMRPSKRDQTDTVRAAA